MKVKGDRCDFNWFRRPSLSRELIWSSLDPRWIFSLIEHKCHSMVSAGFSLVAMQVISLAIFSESSDNDSSKNLPRCSSPSLFSLPLSVSRWTHDTRNETRLILVLVVFATPLITDLSLLCSVFLLQGISQGTTDLGQSLSLSNHCSHILILVGGTSLLMNMWSDHVSAPLNLVHLGYGFGAVLANLLIRRSVGESIVDTNRLPTNQTRSSSENIETSYWLTSFFCLIVGVAHLTLAIRQIVLRRKEKRERRVIEPNVTLTVILANDADKETPMRLVSRSSSCGHGSMSYALSMSIVWIIYMFFLTGNDQTFSKFFFLFLKSSSLSLTRELATWGLIIYWFSYSVRQCIWFVRHRCSSL